MMKQKARIAAVLAVMLTISALNSIAAFAEESGLESIFIPKNVESLGDNCFYQCRSLKSVYIASGSLYTLPYCCFEGCESLEYVNMNSVRTIEDLAFHDCNSLIKVRLPATLENASGSAFLSVWVPYSVTGKKGTYAEKKLQQKGNNV